MEEIKKHPNNTFSWVDLATINTEDAKEFYNELFSWDYVEEPAGEGMVYIMCMLNKKPVAAIYEMRPDQKEMGLPPYWLPYISVENTDDTANKIPEAGGKVIVPPMDVFDNGRMAVIQDNQGAMFALWQSGESTGSAYKNVPGTMSWVELGTNNAESSIDFYKKVFGWRSRTETMHGNEYTTFFYGDNEHEMAAGMYKLTEEMKDVPPHWLTYFNVESVEKAIDGAKAKKGKVIMGPMSLPDIGDFAVIQDPQGGVFGIFG